jgi:hypothetical protein
MSDEKEKPTAEPGTGSREPGAAEGASGASAMPPIGGAKRRRSPFVLLLLMVGAALVIYVSEKAPKEQHLRFVLGSAAARVTRLSCEYEGAEGVARTADFTFDHGDAPRVVAHDPELPNGAYTLHLRVFSKEGQNTIERRVTLSQGTVSVDLAEQLPPPPPTASQTP